MTSMTEIDPAPQGVHVPAIAVNDDGLTTGDSGVIKRGRHGGQTVEIIADDSAKGQFAVKFPSGGFVVISRSNISKMPSPTVTVDAIVSHLAGLPSTSVPAALAAFLESVEAGSSARLDYAA